MAEQDQDFDAEEGPVGSSRARDWFVSEGAWWAASFVFHMLLICTLMLFSAGQKGGDLGDAPSITSTPEPPAPPEKLERFELDKAPVENTVLDTASLTAPPVVDAAAEAPAAGMAEGGGRPMQASGAMLGGYGGFTVVAAGPGVKVTGKGGVGVGVGTGTHAGAGGAGYGFGGRGTGKHAGLGGGGGTKISERAVGAALSWFAHHQMPDGNWSIDKYTQRCKDATCVGAGKAASADSAATALALLPFLAAGQTHTSKGPYQKTIHSGLYWLLKNQNSGTGDLRCGQNMYAHGLASICLCEAYGLSNDPMLGRAAQSAIRFIVDSQNKEDGGWRYNPGDPGDLSVAGWQIMAMKSAQMAGLQVPQATFEKAKAFLDACASEASGTFSYMPGGGGGSPAMTAVGLLCNQYMHMKREDPTLVGGQSFLMGLLPENSEGRRNLYFWYYGTQVMHNLPGPEWDTWNRAMRHALIDSQIKEGCAMGSWDPMRPAKDPWGDQGGRIFVTSLATLSLEVYYRYLPLYKTDSEAGITGAGADMPKAEAAPATKTTAAKKDAPAKKSNDKKAGDKKAGDKKAGDKKQGDKKKDDKKDKKADAAQ